MNIFRKFRPSLPTLKFGDTGGYVKFLQLLLNEHFRKDKKIMTIVDKEALTIDGNFKKLTEKLVLVFQEENCLDTNGIVDEKTWITLSSAVLNNEDEAFSANYSHIPPPERELINWINTILDDASRLEFLIKLVVGLGVIIIASVGSARLDKDVFPKFQPKFIQQELKQPNTSLEISKALPSQAHEPYQLLRNCNLSTIKTNKKG